MKFSSLLITAIIKISIQNCVTHAQDDTVVIGEGACQGANACQNNVLEDNDGMSFGTFLNITGDGACSGANACSDNTSGDTLWITDGCTGGKSTTNGACSSNQGDVTIGAESCSGTSSCSGNTHGLTLGGSACTGAQSCTDNSLRIVVIGEDACTGEDSCSSNVGNVGNDGDEIGYDSDFSVSGGSCTGIKSCRNGRGDFMVLEDACTGENSCQSWKVGNNLTALVSTSLVVFDGGCTGHSSCQGLESDDTNGYISVGEGSCTGLNSCQNVVAPEGGVELTIGDGACTEDNSCQNCETTFIGKGCQNCENSDCDGTENPEVGSGSVSTGLGAAAMVSSLLLLVSVA